MSKNKLIIGISIIIIILLGFSGLVIGCGGGGSGSVQDTSVPNTMNAPPAPNVTFTPDFTPTPEPGTIVTTKQIYAVLVGIADYPGTSVDLSYTAKDADDFEKALKDCGLWENATIVKLTNDQATKQNIRNALFQARLSIDEDGMVVFFYSGHGTVDETLMNAYLVCYDAVSESGAANLALCISSKELELWLKIVPKGASKFVVLDSCFSGAMIDKKLKSNDRIKFIPSEGSASDSKFKGDFAKSLSEVDDLICITACAGWQSAIESSQLQNGLLVYYLVNGLGTGSDIGPADEKGDSVVTATELYNYTSPLVSSYYIFQWPQFLNTGSSDLAVKKN